MQIEIEVTGQKIKRLNSPGSVEDTLNYLTCHFIFVGEEWDNTVRTAYFENQKSGERYAQIIADDGTCTVPWEALTDKGFVRFSVAGEREDYRITTDVESFYNSGTIYGGNPSEPPTPDQYDQMIALAERTKEIAESVRKDADEGKFDGNPGEPGKPGDPGRDGVSPTAKVEQTDDGAVITVTDAIGTTTAELKNGKEGNPGQNATDEQVRGAVDAYMDEHPVQVDTDDLIKIAIKEGASGAVPIVITDSAEMGVQDLTMQGWTEQAQYEGKNLLPVDVGKEITGVVNTDSAVFESDGVTVKYVITSTGISRDIYLFGGSNTQSEDNYADVPELVSGNYLLVNDNANVSFYVVAWRGDSSVILGHAENGTTAITIQDGDKLRIFFRSSNEFDAKIHPMIVKEGDDTTVYEPYTGGAPSPSPDYKQDVENAGNYNEETQKYEYQVKLTGANLFDISKVITNSGFLTNNGDGTLTATPGSGDSAVGGKVPRTLRDYCPELISGKTYRLSANTTGAAKQIYLFGVNNIWTYGRPRTITDADLESEVLFYASGINTEAVISDIMITEVESADYEPYRTPQTVTLTSDRPLTKWDKLTKKNGVWGWEYKSKEYVLNGNERCDDTWAPSMVVYIDGTDNYVAYNESFYCNNFETVSASNANGSGFSINVKNYVDLQTDEAFKDFLAEKAQKGTPVIIWAELKKETFVPLSESEQEAMNALYTFRPTTVLDNDQGCEMSVQYIADTKAYIDKKIGEVQAAIVDAL